MLMDEKTGSYAKLAGLEGVQNAGRREGKENGSSRKRKKRQKPRVRRLFLNKKNPKGNMRGANNQRKKLGTNNPSPKGKAWRGQRLVGK